MRGLKDAKKKSNDGITLIALMVTVIVIIILATITIETLSGKNNIIINAGSAKQQAEIESEMKEVGLAANQAKTKNRYGDVEQTQLENALDYNLGKGKTTVTYNKPNSIFFVKYKDSGRVYVVNTIGDVEYIKPKSGYSIAVIANPSVGIVPKPVYEVNITLKNSDDTGTIPTNEIKYAWSTSNSEEPSTFLKENLVTAKDSDGNDDTSGKTTKKPISSNNLSEENQYYLWTKVDIDNDGTDDTTKIFGPYNIITSCTIRSCSSEYYSYSPFLGNSTIKRNMIERVNLVTSISGHSTNDANCWDVSDSKNGKILAWYEDADSDGYYEVTIGQEGGINANPNSRYLFSYIGYNGDDTTVINGIENLNTSNVTDMEFMFYKCENLTSLDVSNFDTRKVTTMDGMFESCQNLTSLDVSKFNTSNVTSMYYMFGSCENLTSLDLSNFDTSKVTNMNYMFESCQNLTSLDLSNFDTSNVTDMAYMFERCYNLTSLDLSNFDTSKVTSMIYMFFNCYNLTSLDVSKFDTRNVTDMSEMFWDCKNLTSLDVSKFDTRNVTGMQAMFRFCEKLTSLDVSNFDTSKVTDMVSMFSDCKNLTSLDVSKFNTSKVTNMDGMFARCQNLTSLDVSKFDTRNVTIMAGMFSGCEKLTSLDVSKFDTSNVKYMTWMFRECYKLVTIYAGDKWNTDNVTILEDMFTDATSLVGGAGTTYNDSHTDKAYAHIDGGTSNPGYFTSK